MKTFLATFFLLSIHFSLFSQVQESINPELGDANKIIEETRFMPRFTGSKKKSPRSKRGKHYANTKLSIFIYDELKYPQEALKKGIEGRCLVNFVVEKDGTVSHVVATSKLGGGCEEEAVRIIELMNTSDPLWKSGKNKEGKEEARVRVHKSIYFNIAKTKADKIYIVPEEMPRFPGCEKDNLKYGQVYGCANSELTSFIYNHLEYPPEALENNVKGRCTVNFIVEKDGTLSQIEAISQLGGGCEKEAERVFELMNTQHKLWKPGKNKKGQKVRVRLNKTISFYPKGKESTEIFKIVEQMPRFPGCEEVDGNNWKKKNCSNIKLLQFIQANIKYPEEAKKNGTQGRCFVGFIVEKDGTISDFKLIRDIGSGCGEESMRVVKLMAEKKLIWTPGIQRGKKVRVQFNLPVHFKLDKNTSYPLRKKRRSKH